MELVRPHDVRETNPFGVAGCVGITPLRLLLGLFWRGRWVLLFWAGFEHRLQSALHRSAATGCALAYYVIQRALVAPLCRDDGLAAGSALVRLHASSRFFLREACGRGQRHRRGAHPAMLQPAAPHNQSRLHSWWSAIEAPRGNDSWSRRGRRVGFDPCAAQ